MCVLQMLGIQSTLTVLTLVVECEGHHHHYRHRVGRVLYDVQYLLKVQPVLEVRVADVGHSEHSDGLDVVECEGQDHHHYPHRVGRVLHDVQYLLKAQPVLVVVAIEIPVKNMSLESLRYLSTS